MSPDTPPVTASATVYEMLWKCDYCGTDKLLGKSQRFCPNCGAAQNPERRYFPNAEEARAVENYIYLGVDLLCPACNSAIAANCRYCTQCGAPLSEAKQAALKSDATQPAAVPQLKPKHSWLWIAIAALIFLGIGIFALDYFWRREINLELTSSNWRREIKIEQFQALQESAWCDSIPSDAYRVSSHSEIRSYRQVPDGETCSTERIDQGDGTFTSREDCQTRYRSEPVYADKCHFTVNRWRYSRSLTAAGHDRAPYYPKSDLLRSGACLGCEREQQRLAEYYLNLATADSRDKPLHCAISETLWQQAEPGSHWSIEAGILSGTTHCDTLKPLR